MTRRQTPPSSDSDEPEFIRWAETAGLFVEQHIGQSRRRYRIAPVEQSPFYLDSEVSADDPHHAAIWGYVRTSSWQFSGGPRSELHELFTLVLTLMIRRLAGISGSVITVRHPATEEICAYAHLISFERYGLTDVDIDPKASDTLRRTIGSVGFASNLPWKRYAPDWHSESAAQKADFRYTNAWAQRVLSAIGEKLDYGKYGLDSRRASAAPVTALRNAL